MSGLRHCVANAASARAPSAQCLRPGFSLVEALVAVVLLGFGAAAAAAGQAWAARTLARAEVREDAAAAAELILDSLAQDLTPGAGRASQRGIALEWRVTGTAAAGEAVVRATAAGRGVQLDESWGVVLAAPPPLAGAP